MPRVVVQLIFYIPGIVDKPYKKALLSVYIDVLIEKLSKQIGFEATQADVAYSIKVFENVALKFKFKGYNDKIEIFIKEALKIFKDLQEPENFLIDNSVEKILKEYKNHNVEIDQRSTNNRLILLCQDNYHAEVLEHHVQSDDIK